MTKFNLFLSSVDEFVEFLTKSDGKFEEAGTCEADVGIDVFMNPDLEGFDAILKHRFSDFNVNEIDMDGKIVKITDLEVPKAVTKASFFIVVKYFLILVSMFPC